MKKIRFAIACTVVLSVLTLGAAAQTHTLAKANVPFSFSAHDTTFPAGIYEVRQIGHNLLRLQDAKGVGVTIFAPSTLSESTGMKLMFRQYPDGVFLASVDDTKLGYSASVAPSDTERKIQKMRNRATIVALQTTR